MAQQLTSHASITTGNQSAGTVYIADSDIEVSHSIEFLLAADGLNTAVFDSGHSLYNAVLERQPGCAVLAATLPDTSGVLLLRQLRQKGVDFPVIILANTSDIPSAVYAVKSGAWDYLEKPLLQSALIASVRKALN